MKKGVKSKGIKKEDMMVSYPKSTTPSLPDFKEMIAREIEKLREKGIIPGLIYSRARDLLPVLYPSIFNMFYRQERNLERAVAFLLRQANREPKRG